MLREVIVLCHKISNMGREVNHENNDLITNPPYRTNTNVKIAQGLFDHARS